MRLPAFCTSVKSIGTSRCCSMRKSVEVPNHADRTRLIVEYDHRSRTHAAAGLLYLGKIHRDVEVLFHEEVRRGSKPCRPDTSDRRVRSSFPYPCGCRPSVPR